MALDLATLRTWRVASQKLGAKGCRQAVDAVEHLAGVQAQDYRWAMWSIGLRTAQVTRGDVERAIEMREVVHTWMFRGTLHFVAAADLPWLTALLAPVIIRGNARRYRQLALDDEAFAASQHTIRRALDAHGALTRAGLVTFFQQDGVPAEGQQVPYLLQRAALDGLICHGLPRDGEPTYVLLSGWITPAPAIEPLDRDEVLAGLAARYIAGHGPATDHDFAWWAGLRMSEARRGLETASGLTRVDLDGTEYWATGDPPPPAAAESGCLLPRFDEYLMGYKERGAMLDPAHAKRVNAGGGMPKPTVMVDGEVVGTWRYEEKKDVLAVSVESFAPLTALQRDRIERAAARLAEYDGQPVDLV